MTDFCALYLSNVPFIAKTFMVAALIVAVLGALVGIYQALKAAPPQPPTEAVALAQANASALTPLVEALTKLLEALAKGPAWFAMFLAGLLLFWIAGEAHRKVCPPASAMARAPQGGGVNNAPPASRQPDNAVQANTTKE